MSLQPPEEPARDEPPTGPENTGPSRNRIILWVIVGGIALYLIGSGVYGILVT
ncbi:hypothetical protein QMG61_08320 [Cryobacterium sp. PH31-AA6]|uniref:hypothetical protein n=1 Tax=Cryobacterium sp. PH31-AA6 TaxID=3046205 RepID=UPI0024B9AFA2|nr:hypothetical protein [Cryobacterium sp. PH31-AA6]MDJ0323765.1 hypothetical protein [Cryobacterium sp. PH31-AA6]